MTAIEFIEDFEKAFNEMKRVVKAGGKILLGTIRKDSDWGRLYKKQAQREDSFFSDAIFREPEELEKITSKMNENNSEFSMSINISNSCS